MLAFGHNLTNDEIRHKLSLAGIELERHYVGKLVKKIYAERMKRADGMSRSPMKHAGSPPSCGRSLDKRVKQPQRQRRSISM
jgi:hypothetical protein